MTACIDRGHFDGHRPSFRITLHAQVGPIVQRVLFPAAPIVELYPQPACDHLEVGWQKNLFNEMEHVCTFCGAEVSEVGR